MSEVNRLRSDAQITVSELASTVNDSFLLKEDFNKYNQDLQKKLYTLNRDNKNIINQLSNLTKILDEKLNINIATNDIPSTSQTQEDNVSTTTRRDDDNDVIMRNAFSNRLQQVPEPGFFSGDTKETDLFCQLCEDTFKTYPNSEATEDIKINFIKSRLRDGARNWYLATYKDTNPKTLSELTTELRKAFSNVASKKLAKIQLIKLKHNYGKINDYIEQFRTLSNGLGFSEEALVLIFYNGLHSKFQEVIEEMEEFPVDLGTIYTKCILLENTLKTKNQIKTNNGNSKLFRSSNNKHSKHVSTHINHDKNYNSNNNYNNKSNYNNNYNNNNYNSNKTSSNNNKTKN